MGDSIVIYQINNYSENKPNFVCSDQATIDNGISLGFQGIFSLGGTQEADSILAANAQAWLVACADRFSTNKDIDPDPVQTTWMLCDLNTESENTDTDYNIFNTLNGSYVTVTGLTNAKDTLTELKQSFLDFSGLTSYTTLDTWPISPNHGTQGTQTL